MVGHVLLRIAVLLPRRRSLHAVVLDHFPSIVLIVNHSGSIILSLYFLLDGVWASCVYQALHSAELLLRKCGSAALVHHQ